MFSTALRASFWMLWISSEISLVDCADFSASFRTSSATTANPKSVLPGARSFDGGVQSQQVGLLGQVVDDFDDLADIVGALAQRVDDFAGRVNRGVDAVQAVGGLLHGADAAVNFFARTVGDVEQNFRGVGDALDRGDHLIDGSRGLADAGSLHLRALHHVLHVDAHLVHGAGDFVDGRGGLQADLGRLVGGAGHLIGGAGDLGRGIAYAANQAARPSTILAKALPRVS